MGRVKLPHYKGTSLRCTTPHPRRSIAGYIAALQGRQPSVEAGAGVLAGEVDLVRPAGVVCPHGVGSAPGIDGHGDRVRQTPVRVGDHGAEDSEAADSSDARRSEEHTSELQSP